MSKIHLWPLPEANTEHYRGIVVRAQAILKERSDAEINAIIDLLAWLDRYTALERLQEWLTSPDKDDAAQAHDDLRYAGTLGLLRQFYEKVPFQFLDHTVSNVQWPELFAALALWQIHGASSSEEYVRRFNVPAHEGTYPRIVIPCAIEAMEAVIIAETLAAGQRPLTTQAQTLSELGQRGAKARHQDVNALKHEFIEFYQSGDFVSREKAASQFYSKLPPEKKRLLRPSYATKTLLRALRAHAKASEDPDLT